MSTISYVKGDATAPPPGGARIICHVCNDIGGWGRGFVTAISRRWPEPERAFRAWHEAGDAAGFRLGAVALVRVEPELWVANMIAQRDVRSVGGVPPIRYDALRECLEELATQAASLGASVHMPRIGCGLAGGEWAVVEKLIAAALCQRQIAVAVYDL